MEKIGFGKSAVWVAVILCSLLSTVIAQPGFLSIACGGKTNHTDENNITWVTDTNYIDVGERADIGDASQLAYGSYLHTLRFFPKPLNKSCYQLPVIPNVPYLLRLWFAVGNYTGFHTLPSFRFSIETLGKLIVRDVRITSKDPIGTDEIFVSYGSVLYICLIRKLELQEFQDPFISAIELKTLQHGMYPQATPERILSINTRCDVGASSWVRYPQDEFDRIWQSDIDLNVSPYPADTIQKVSSEELISTSNTQDLPPSVVMQTAWTTREESLRISLQGGAEGTNLLLLLYFAEIEPLNMTETRSFSVSINNILRSGNITFERHYSALELPLLSNETSSEFTLLKAGKSTLGPIVNAFETYVIIDMESATYIEDIEALHSIKTSFHIKSWISDPCYVIELDGIGCDNSSSVRRISEINFSGMKLSGSVPQKIGQLTALVNLSLQNNHLTGPLPNFSNLTKLERLHLQNNNLTGSVPDWLSGLKNLKELFIENNSFSGVIPAQLLSSPSLEFRHTGNRYLYTPSNPNKDRLRLILGITLSGSIVIVLVLIVGVVVHCQKYRRKESSRVEKESKHSVDEDNSMIILPNTTKSRAFTLEEIMAATENFSQKIGQGGFGSVFFGKLQQEKDIAVKVLSLFAEQGVREFVNEVDLLSRVHHKNLVSLLGYCNEPRELMLVYEYMSGGSLRDHLYGALQGPSADLSELNWKRRLKIASDAAQGLEYLHVDCTPKIIHRDIKTANILLDSNFNGKLADFGLSRVTIDGEASHVTTTVKGTIGYLDPEYFSTQMLTEKSDVYSFGVVLLEIICGRQPINANLSEEQMNLIRWVTPHVEMNGNPCKLEEIIDKRLGRNYDIKSITDVAKLAIRCVQEKPSSRPHVSKVVAELKEAIKLENAKDSLISEIDIEYRDYSTNPVCSSVDSSGSKEMESAESSGSKLPTVREEGR